MTGTDTDLNATDPMPLYYHALYRNGISPDARFPRDRYDLIRQRLTLNSPNAPVRIMDAPEARLEQIVLAHDDTYARRFLDGEMTEKETRRIGLRPWTDLIMPRTLHIMGGALSALQDAHVSTGFAANMAGGTHHAHYDWGSGFCVFNDIAICARAAQHQLGYTRIAIIDLDVHQGDGTATILAHDPCTLTVSIHCESNFPFRKAVSDIDIALPIDTRDGDYLIACEHVLRDVDEFEPQLILFQGGVDGLETDRLGRLNLTRNGLKQRNALVYEYCLTNALPCVIFMGGGYSEPIDRTIDCFYDLFAAAAVAHQQRRMGG